MEDALILKMRVKAADDSLGMILKELGGDMDDPLKQSLRFVQSLLMPTVYQDDMKDGQKPGAPPPGKK